MKCELQTQITLAEIKKLNKKEFAERYPFLHIREWDNKLKTTKLSYCDNGDPCLEFYLDDFWGWTDLLLCWAEKVKEIYDNFPKELKEKWYVVEVKEKYGTLRIYTTGCLEKPFEKINDYISMAEHLSSIVCINCGKITKTSNNKKAIIWQSKGGWMMNRCKQCAKDFTLQDLKDYYDFNIKNNIVIKNFFKKDWKRTELDYYARWVEYHDDIKIYYKIDSRELLKGYGIK